MLSLPIRRLFLGCFTTLGLMFIGPAGESRLCAQYSPEHPKVVEIVNKALDYLSQPTASVGLIGEKVLVGYAILLGRSDPDHPHVARGVETSLEIIRKAVGGSTDQHIVYDVSVAVMFLASLDPQRYRSQLETARDWLLSNQRTYGGFGYLSGQYLQSGDISQTQYAVLALWALHKVGIKVPAPAVENVVRYLMATQDPSGAWGYQGVMSRGGGLVPQQMVSRSLATAGIGALLMSADVLRLLGGSISESDGIPSVFERIDDRPVGQQESRTGLKRSDIDSALQLAFKYQDVAPPQDNYWYYYWRYAQERYESFREVVDGKRPLSPSWYNEAVEEFAKSQSASGAWTNGGGIGSTVDTAFVVLYLIRSTQRAISKLGEGLVFGGYELPTDITSVRMVGDKIVSDAETSVANLLELMESEEGRVTEGMLPKEMQLSADARERSAQVARLARLLGSDNFTARRLAARLLGRSEEIQVAPDLIYALLDPDPHVPKIAEEGLRLLSRKLDVVHLNVDPTDEERHAAANYWKQWYLGLRPDHVFLER